MNFNPNESAVIVLLEESSNSLVLTQRSVSLRDHPGDICFPGGYWQEGDSDFLATALREMDEELGIEASRIQLIKKLELEKTLKGTIIHPWLATIDTIEPYEANQEEVAAVLTLPMHDVTQSSHYKDVVLERNGKRVKTCQFTATHYFVWGATARIMKQLSQCPS